MAYQFYNPERIYLNLSASALASSYSLSTDPDATYNGDRSQPVVGNLKNYKLSVVRCSLQGQRNFPLYIPTIQLGQPRWDLTTLNLSITASWPTKQGTYTPVAPSATGNPTWRTTVYDSTGAIQELFNCPMQFGTTTPGNTATGWAAGAQLAYQKQLNGIPYYQIVKNMLVSAFGPSTNLLGFSLVLPAGWTFSLSPNPQFPDGVLYTDAVTGMGFPYGSTVTNELYSTLSPGDGTTPCTLTLPYPCSYTYTPPSATGNTAQTTATAPIIWESQTTDAPIPAPPATSQDMNAPAYQMYDYTWFVRLLNKTLKTAWTQVLATADGAFFPTFGAPSVKYNAPRQSFVLTWDYDAATTPIGTLEKIAVSITLNEQLANLMAWPATYLSNGDATLIWDSATGSIGEPAQLTSDYPATANAWSPISSLVFMSSTLPVRAEITTPITQFGANNVVLATADTAQILSDVVPAFSDAADWDANIILYTPTVLRWVDLNDMTGALTNLNFAVAWRNAITGDITPVKLNPTSSFSVKLLLQRKDIPF